MIGLIAWSCLLTFFWFGEYGFSTVGVGVIGTVVWWLVRQDGSAVVGDRHSEWECKFRLFS